MSISPVEGQGAEAPSPFEKLPDEIILAIGLSGLSPSAIASLQLVSHRFRRIFSDSYFWKLKFRQLVSLPKGENYQTLFRQYFSLEPERILARYTGEVDLAVMGELAKKTGCLDLIGLVLGGKRILDALPKLAAIPFGTVPDSHTVKEHAALASDGMGCYSILMKYVDTNSNHCAILALQNDPAAKDEWHVVYDSVVLDFVPLQQRRTVGFFTVGALIRQGRLVDESALRYLQKLWKDREDPFNYRSGARYRLF